MQTVEGGRERGGAGRAEMGDMVGLDECELERGVRGFMG